MSKKNIMLIVGAIIVLIVMKFAFSAVSTFMGQKIVENVMERATNGKADVNLNNDGTMDIKTEQGTFSTGEAVPENWPKDVPTYPNAKVSYAANANPTEGKATSALVLMTDDKGAAVKDFYNTELVSKDWKITNTMQGEGMIIMTAEKEGRSLSIAITESSEKTSVTIGVEAAK